MMDHTDEKQWNGDEQVVTVVDDSLLSIQSTTLSTVTVTNLNCPNMISNETNATKVEEPTYMQQNNESQQESVTQNGILKIKVPWLKKENGENTVSVNIAKPKYNITRSSGILVPRYSYSLKKESVVQQIRRFVVPAFNNFTKHKITSSGQQYILSNRLNVSKKTNLIKMRKNPISPTSSCRKGNFLGHEAAQTRKNVLAQLLQGSDMAGLALFKSPKSAASTNDLDECMVAFDHQMHITE